MIVIPAYGRDYKTREDVIKDWEGNKDFVIQDVSCKYNGKYINKNDAINGNVKEVKIRFNKLEDFVFVKV